jgi:phosphoadenosine phosphosulfate reductase
MLEKKTEDLLQALKDKSIKDSLKYLSENFSKKIVFSTSLGQEDQVITDFIFNNNIDIEVFTLDTGRLFSETYDLLYSTENKYKKKIKLMFPDATKVEEFVNNKGINSFYDTLENRKECCYIRKIAPLKRALKGNEIWITGLRADQNENRQNIPTIEWDEANQIIKYHPLLSWSLQDVVDYINENKVPYNKLHDKNYVSIGCAPCTRAIEPGEDFRAGRWWWETSNKECGLHTK